MQKCSLLFAVKLTKPVTLEFLFVSLASHGVYQFGAPANSKQKKK